MIDKPKGLTSAKVVSKIKETLKIQKVGHTGTLDPFATGLLIICLNRATGIAQYISDLDKTYVGTMILGISTDTQDLKGRVLTINSVNQDNISYEAINSVFSKFRGNIRQIPPMFSAIKYKGLRLYKLARKGIKINLTPRKVKIFQLDIVKIKYDRYPSITFQVRCSKGTYIRTLCQDIGETLGFGAHMSDLRRTDIDDYSIKHAISLDSFLRLSKKEQYDYILPINKALRHLNKITLLKNEQITKKVKNGRSFSEQETFKINTKNINTLNEKFTVYSFEGDLLAIANKIKKNDQENRMFKVEKVFS